MNIAFETRGDAVVVRLEGQIDGRTAPQIQSRISALIEPGRNIVLDLTDVTYLSSAGLRLLATTQRNVTDNDGQLVLVGLSERIRDTMSITGFLPVFRTYETVEAAMAGLE
jgi:anti-sigma B factor antagonist